MPMECSDPAHAGPCVAAGGDGDGGELRRGLSAGVAQGGGLSIHPNAVAFKLEKLNPVTNLGNLFSLRSVTRMVKSLVPAAVMVLLGWSALKS